MTTVIAVHKIRVSQPGAPLIHTGQFDKEGNPLLKRVPKTVQPGEFFEIEDQADLGRLLEMGAVRLPIEGE